jgi:hypothetical protein
VHVQFFLAGINLFRCIWQKKANQSLAGMQYQKVFGILDEYRVLSCLKFRNEKSRVLIAAISGFLDLLQGDGCGEYLTILSIVRYGNANQRLASVKPHARARKILDL